MFTDLLIYLSTSKFLLRFTFWEKLIAARPAVPCKQIARRSRIWLNFLTDAGNMRLQCIGGNAFALVLLWPGVVNDLITRMPPIVAEASAYGAIYNFQWLSAAGTSCFLAAFTASLVLGMSIDQFIGVCGRVLKQLSLPLLTIASVLGLAFLMNYAGMTSTLGLAFAATGTMFPFSSKSWVMPTFLPRIPRMNTLPGLTECQKTS